MRRMVGIVVVLAFGGAAGAQTVTDAFGGSSPNPAYWGTDDVEGLGVLTQANGRLEFTVNGGSPEDFTARPWILGAGPYAGSWEVQLDVANVTVPGLGMSKRSVQRKKRSYAAT